MRLTVEENKNCPELCLQIENRLGEEKLSSKDEVMQNDLRWCLLRFLYQRRPLRRDVACVFAQSECKMVNKE